MKKILIVDDSKTARTALLNFISKAGFVAIEAEDGLQGYQCCREHPDISLVITDLNMPIANGIDLLKKLMADESTRTIPAVVLTSVGKGDARLLTEARDSGARGWLVKPLKESEFEALVQKFVTPAKVA